MDAFSHPENSEGLGDLVVSKSNALIQGSYSLTLTEQRLLLCCIGQVNPMRSPGAQRQRNMFRVSVAEYQATFPDAKSGALYSMLKESTKRLFDRSIKVKEGRKTTLIRWVQDVTYHDGEGWVELNFSDKVAPYLTLLGTKFTRYKIEQISGLRSTYSLRIFEHLMQFQDTGWCEVQIDELKDRLQLPYERFTDIRRYVLDTAVNELNSKSNLVVTWQAIKKGRAVDRIRFDFKPDPQGKLDL